MMNRIFRLHLILVLVGLSVAPAWAQELPAHTPGTICASPDNYWCWIARKQIGAPCTCPSPYGPVNGTAS